MAKIRIGVSGWNYDHWRDGFYPKEVPKKRQLEYIGKQFNSVEINGSFYSLLSPKTYGGYYERTPRDFLFAVKGSRFITHTKKLKDIKIPLANFFASGLLGLRDKLGPILWQFPAQKLDLERLEHFLDLLPKDAEEASKLARQHDDKVAGKAFTEVDGNHRIRHAVEIRGEDAFVPECVKIIRDHGMALVFSDAGSWPYTEEVTAGFVYIRLHGSPDTYASRYQPRELDRWAERIRVWRDGEEPSDAERITGRKPPRRKTRDVYVYFDNDFEANAPQNARELMERLGVSPPDSS